MIKCIGLDLDNTLYPEEQYYFECYRVIAEREFSGDMAVAHYMRKIRNELGDSKVFQMAQQHCFKDKDFISRCVEIYHSCDANLRMYPDAEQFLNEKIERMNYALLTNGGVETQRNKLRCLGVEQFFDTICITGEYLPRERWKPSIYAFSLLSKIVGCSPEEVLFVGDPVVNDAEGASHTGMQTILLDRNKRYFGGKYKTVAKLTEVKEILRGLNGNGAA